MSDPTSSSTNQGRHDAHRLNALTDGVVAIAITLLALDLKPTLQSDATSRQLAHAIRDNLDQYIAFAIAFWLIAQYWSVHHRVMRGVDHSDDRLNGLTFLFLFWVTLAPLTTSMNGKYGNSLSTFLFALNILLISGSASLLGITVRRHRLADGVEKDRERIQREARSLVTLFVPALVCVLAWVLGPDADWFFLLFIVAGQPSRIAARRRLRRSTESAGSAGSA